MGLPRSWWEGSEHIFSFPWNITPSLKRSRFRYPRLFILSSPILLLSASAFPFETLCPSHSGSRTAFFPIVFAAFFHHGNVTVSRQRQPSLPVTRLSSLHGLFQISFASSFSAQHWLVSFICARSHISFSCRDSVIHLSLYCHRKRVPLPVSAFNREVRMFILTGFINYLAQLLRHMEAVKGDFLNRTG